MKERLTGAIILVALLVLLVPELLTGPSRSASPTTRQAPTNADGAQLRSYTINLSDDPNTQRAGEPPVTETPSALASVEAPSTSAGDATAPGESATTTPRPAGDEESRVAADKIPAAVGDAPVARADGARSSSAPPLVPRASAAEGRKNASRADAGSKSGMSADAPAAANVARSGSTQAPSGKGWAVQVGSFASRENAEKLTRQLKGKGFAATVSESSGKGGKRLWRVRVGPESDRAAAVALGARLRAAGQPGGAVVPYP